MSRNRRLSFNAHVLWLALAASAWTMHTLAQAQEGAKPRSAPATQKPLAEQPAPGKEPAPKADQPAEPKLKFNFRYQKWIDVLEWFAGESGLSLVLDAPPPGSFNYSDSREYTPAEAIDLLNGVLVTKGYTLVRRERMLHVVNLAAGLPEGVVPQIPFSELDKRGKFEFVSVLFPLENRNADEVAKEIGPLLNPRGKAVPLPKTKQLLVTDTAGVMRAVSAVIQSIPQLKDATPTAAEKPLLTVYPLKTADPQVTYNVLHALLPDVNLAIDAKNEQLSAFATPTQHAAVKSMLEQLQASNPPDKQPKLEVYAAREANATLIATLQPLVPGMKLSLGPSGTKIAAFGTPAEHALFKQALAQLGRTGGESEPKLRLYTLAKGDPAAAVKVLQSLVSSATFTVDEPTRSVIAVADERDQQTIKTAIEQLEAAPGRPARSLVVYSVTAAQRKRFEALRAKADGELAAAAVLGDNEPGRLAVWATREGHSAVATALEQLRREPPAAERMTLSAYAIKSADPASVVKVLESLFPDTKFILDVKTRKIAAWAQEDQHAAIRGILTQLDSDAPEEAAGQVTVYRLKFADPSTAVATLKALVPDATLSVDPKAGTVIARATKFEHKTIVDVIERMDKAGETPTAQVKLHALNPGEASGVLTVVQGLYASRPDVRLSLDAAGERLVAVAPPADQQRIAELVAELERGAAGIERAQIELYSLDGIDTTNVKQLLATLLAAQGVKAQLTVDTPSRQLIAVAAAAQQPLVRATLDRLRAAPASLDVIPLDVVEPQAAVAAIEKLLGDPVKGGAAKVDVDRTSGQLFVRGTKEQLAQVRELLAKMGETRLADKSAGRTVRVVNVSGDPQAALKEIERIWPQLRANPIKVVTPSAVVPLLKASRANPQPPEKKPELPSTPKESDEKPHSTKQCQAPPADAPAEQAPAAPKTDRPPIIVAPGTDNVTIASDDPEALDQFEALLRAMSQRRGPGGREFVVYTLRGANATEMATLLEGLFRASPSSLREPAAIVADRRLNAVIVHAGRADQANIKGLLEVLDAAELPESLVADTARMIPVKNTRAERIEKVLRELYKAQLTTGGGRPPIPVTSSMSSELASVVQQINLANAAPLLTLSVDEPSNAIVALGPKRLLYEVQQMVERLDRAAVEESSRVVKLVPLKKTSAQRLQDMLDTMLEREGRRKAR